MEELLMKISEDVKIGLSNLNGDVARLQKDVSKLERSNEELFKTVMRSEIRQYVSPGDCSKPLELRSISDLMGFLIKSNATYMRADFKSRILEGLMRPIEKEPDAPVVQFLKSLDSDLQLLPDGSSDSELQELGKLYKATCPDSKRKLTDLEVLKDFIGALGFCGRQGRLKDALLSIQEYLQTPDEEKRRSKLLAPKGPSLYLALYLSMKDSSVEINKMTPALRVCEEDLDLLDVRGEVEVQGERALAWTGEIKSCSKSLQTVKQRLEMRLDLIEWVVRTLWPEVQIVYRTGRIFTSGKEIRMNL